MPQLIAADEQSASMHAPAPQKLVVASYAGLDSDSNGIPANIHVGTV